MVDYHALISIRFDLLHTHIVRDVSFMLLAKVRVLDSGLPKRVLVYILVLFNVVRMFTLSVRERARRIRVRARGRSADAAAS